MCGVGRQCDTTTAKGLHRYLHPTTHYTHALHEVLDCHILNNGACLGGQCSDSVRFRIRFGSYSTSGKPNDTDGGWRGGDGCDGGEERDGAGAMGGIEGCGGGRWRGRGRFPNMYVCLTIVRETLCVGGRERWEEGGVGMGGERSTRPWNEPHRFAWNDPPPMDRPSVNNYGSALGAV